MNYYGFIKQGRVTLSHSMNAYRRPIYVIDQPACRRHIGHYTNGCASQTLIYPAPWSVCRTAGLYATDVSNKKPGASIPRKRGPTLRADLLCVLVQAILISDLILIRVFQLILILILILIRVF